MAKVYTTVQGDSWDLISYRLFGDEHYVAELIAANFEHRFIELFPAGVVLNVPVIEEPAAVSNLPAWRQGAKI